MRCAYCALRHIRSCRGRHFWRANPPGRGRRLLTAWCRKAWESCSQLSAKRVWSSGSGTDGCALVFHTGEAGSMPAARSIPPPSSTSVRRLRLSPEQSRIVAGGGHHKMPGCGSRPNRPAFEAEVGARAPRTFKSCSRCHDASSNWRQFVGEQRLLITTASPDRHRGPLPIMPA